jgi:hypothetical protein
MGLDIGGSINSTSDWLCNKSYLSTAIRNPFSAALLITAIIVIIILANYSLLDGTHEKRVKLVKTSIYIYIGIMSFLFIHYSSITECVKATYKDQESEDVMQNINNLRDTAPDISPFSPLTDSTSGVASVTTPSSTTLPSTSVIGAGEGILNTELTNPNIPDLSSL